MRDLVIFISGLLQQLPMKQLALLMAIFVVGSLGALYHPFWALLLYYVLAVLRPQYLWRWALPVEWRWSLFAAIIVFVSLLINLPRVAARGKLNAIAGLMIAYSLWLGLSILTAFDPGIAQHWGIEFGKIMLIALIASVVIDSFWQVRALSLSILVALGYVAWEINSMYLIHGRLTIFHEGFGGLDNNGAGLMIAMGIPFAYMYGTSAPKLWHRWGAWLLGIFMLHAVLMSYSRGAMLSAVVGVIWLLLHHRPRLQMVLMTVGLALVLSVLAGAEIRERFISTARYQQDGSAQSRLDSWAAGWQIAWDHPLTGKGIRNSQNYTQNYGADNFQRTIHSQYIQIAADSGIPAMLLFILILVVAMVYMNRCRRMCRDQLDSDDLPLLKNELRDRVYSAHQIIVGCQASLFIYIFGAVFLSLEVFELPWLLIMLAGVMPRTLKSELHVAARHAEKHLEPKHKPSRPKTLVERQRLRRRRPARPAAATPHGWAH